MNFIENYKDLWEQLASAQQISIRDSLINTSKKLTIPIWRVEEALIERGKIKENWDLICIDD